MMTIKAVDERVYVKKYVTVDYNDKIYTVYICNERISGVYFKHTEKTDLGVVENSTYMGKSLKRIFGVAPKQFLQEMNYEEENIE